MIAGAALGLVLHGEADQPEAAVHAERAGETRSRVALRAAALRFLTTHAAIYNTFYAQRHLISRPTLRRIRSDAAAAWVVATA